MAKEGGRNFLGQKGAGKTSWDEPTGDKRQGQIFLRQKGIDTELCGAKERGQMVGKLSGTNVLRTWYPRP